jgi:uncharacterized protein (DUF2225 family)
MNFAMFKTHSGAKRYQDKQVIIYDRQQMGNEMFIILSGSVGVYKNYGDPGQHKLATLSQGSFFGEMTMFLNKPRTATVVAEGEAVLLIIDRINAYHYFEKEPELIYYIIQALCQRLDNANTRISQMADGNTAMPQTPSSATPAAANAPAASSAPAPAAAAKPATPELAELLPEGHKNYDFTPPMPNAALLYDKKFTCPLCSSPFQAKAIRTTKLKVVSRAKDFRVTHDGIDTTYHEIISCPSCAFTGFEDAFNSTILARFKLGRTEIYPLLDALDFEDTTTPVTAHVFARFFAAMKCAPLFFQNFELAVAKAWLRVVWLYRDCGDEDMALMATKQAQKAYLTAFANSELSDAALQQLSLIIGELSLVIDDLDTAKTYFLKARANRGNALAQQAEDGIDEVKRRSM